MPYSKDLLYSSWNLHGHQFKTQEFCHYGNLMLTAAVFCAIVLLLHQLQLLDVLHCHNTTTRTQPVVVKLLSNTTQL